jgi:hypothetical protein
MRLAGSAGKPHRRRAAEADRAAEDGGAEETRL